MFYYMFYLVHQHNIKQTEIKEMRGKKSIQVFVVDFTVSGSVLCLAMADKTSLI